MRSQKPSSHRSIDPAAPMTSRTAGFAASPISSTHSSAPPACTRRMSAVGHAVVEAQRLRPVDASLAVRLRLHGTQRGEREPVDEARKPDAAAPEVALELLLPVLGDAPR